MRVFSRAPRLEPAAEPTTLDYAPAPLAWIRDRSADAFIVDLRKFVLSRGLAAIATGAGPIDVSPVRALSTGAAELEQWHGWSAEGKAFVESLREGEVLELALAPYPLLVSRFIDWLGRWRASVHRRALEELADLQRGFTGTDAPRPGDSVVDVGDATLPASWLHEPTVADAS